MKKLLVIALALMPSLSISVMAQSPGSGPSTNAPDSIPVKEHPSPNPSPRVRSNGPDNIPIVPDPTTYPGGWPRSRNSAKPPHCYRIGGVVTQREATPLRHLSCSIKCSFLLAN